MEGLSWYGGNDATTTLEMASDAEYAVLRVGIDDEDAALIGEGQDSLSTMIDRENAKEIVGWLRLYFDL